MSGSAAVSAMIIILAAQHRHNEIAANVTPTINETVSGFSPVMTGPSMALSFCLFIAFVFVLGAVISYDEEPVKRR